MPPRWTREVLTSRGGGVGGSDDAESSNPQRTHRPRVAGNLDRVERAFDTAAPIFDSRDRNPIAVWTRRTNLTWLQAIFPPGTHLIELGCGTGDDAVSLAAEGRWVFAVDLSERMVEASRRRVHEAGLEDRVAVVRGRSVDIEELLKDSPWERFDGAYASFSLFTEDDLRPIAKALYAVLPAGATFVCTLGNRLVMSEFALYSALLRPRKALWRLRQPMEHNVYGERVRVHGYFPAEARKAFSGYFDLRAFAGLPSVLPPVYLGSRFSRMPALLKASERLDGLLSRRFPWKHLGENVFYEFIRTGTARQRRSGRIPR